MILETCQPLLKSIHMLYHRYLTKLSSTIDVLISGQKGAYRYLGHSATNYLNTKQVSRMLTHAGFRRVDFKPLLW